MNNPNIENRENIFPQQEKTNQPKLNNKSTILEECLNETQLAKHWQVSKKLLQKMRYKGSGPKFIKIGSLVRYPLSEITKYEQDNRHSNTCELGSV